MLTNAVILSVHDMQSVCSHCRTEFLVTHPFLCCCFSGDYCDVVDLVLSEYYDELGYDFSFKGLG